MDAVVATVERPRQEAPTDVEASKIAKMLGQQAHTASGQNAPMGQKQAMPSGPPNHPAGTMASGPSNLAQAEKLMTEKMKTTQRLLSAS